MNLKDLKVRILGDTSDFERSMKGASTSLANVADKSKQYAEVIGANSTHTSRFSSTIDSLNKNLLPLAGITAAASMGLNRLVGFMGDSVGQANSLQGALIGLNSVARAFGVDSVAAQKAAQKLASDGLMTVTEAATGLKNLLASHFNLDQAIMLMNRFKDSAAFNRQASLSFGYAVASATEGIKNGNSILVDNAGVTKNLSLILQEAGYSAQDLMKATTDAGVRQALFGGIIKETNAQVGDAARLSETAAGAQSRAAAQTKVMQQNIGIALQAALLPLLRVLTPIVSAIAQWVEHHQKLAAIIGVSAVIFLGLLSVVGLLAAAIGALAPIIAVVGGGAVAIGAAIGAAFALAAAVVIVNFDWIKKHWELILVLMLGPIGFFIAQVIKHWDWLKNSFSDAINGIRSVLSSAAGFISAPFRWEFNQIARFWNSTVGRLDFKAPSWVPGIGGKGWNMPQIPYFAMGISNFSGGSALVGEHGPELVYLPRGSSVKTATETQTALASSAQQPKILNTYNYEIHATANLGMYAGMPIEKRQIAEDLWRELVRSAKAQGVILPSIGSVVVQ